MHFTLDINCNGAAFTNVTGDEDNGTPNPGPAVGTLLSELGRRISRTSAIEDGDDWPIIDSWGNRVGTARFREEDDHPLDVATTSVRDVELALAAVGAQVTERETTPGAVGYTRLTIRREARP